MGEQLIVGPFNRGLKTNRLPFYIDNDSFPTLINAYAWRGRVKRKRGTQFLSRLNRDFLSAPTKIVLVGGNGNLISGFLPLTQANATLKPGSITIIGVVANYTDPAADGILVGGGGGTVNYATGAISIPGEAGNAVIGGFTYYPDLPVMGLEELRFDANTYNAPATLGFDTAYSYLFDSITGTNKSVSFYKSTKAPLNWSGTDYQQFWSCNYQGAFWATNGVPGMQFQKSTTTVSVTHVGSDDDVVFTMAGAPLMQVNDYVWTNEFQNGGSSKQNINQQTGIVTKVLGANVTVRFTNTAIVNLVYTNGILQVLTRQIIDNAEGIRWYDGDPIATANGWVNFAPPLSSIGNVYAIDDAPASTYYLCGAKVIIPFKDRLLFFGPTICTSNPGSNIYLQDYVIYSEVGTPYYTTSYDAATLPFTLTTNFNPILTPANQVARPQAFWTDQTGYGGFASAGVEEPIRTVNPEKDVLIVGFGSIGQFSQLTYTGNDIFPFAFYTITTEWGPDSTFSSVTMDRGALTFGNYGLIRTGIEGAERIDLDIPDQVIQVNNSNHGQERVCGQRDYIQEWVYFTYGNSDELASSIYPTQTLFYNYRENTWALFNETYTTYGIWHWVTGTVYTWNNPPAPSWTTWTAPWNSGSTAVGNPMVIAGNQQGYVLLRDNTTTNESVSLYIKDITGPNALITSPDHCLVNGDYIVISGCLWTGASLLNGNVYQVSNATQNTFTIADSIGANVYIGGGEITRIYNPFIMTKQFPLAWSLGRKTRIGRQNYLFTSTDYGQLTANIYLSTDTSTAYNSGLIVPFGGTNNALVYSNIIYTSPQYETQSVYRYILGNLGNGVLLNITFNLNAYFDVGYEVVRIPGTFVLTVYDTTGAAWATFTNNATVVGSVGQFNVTGQAVSAGSSVDYSTGDVVLVFSSAPLATYPFYTNLQYYMPNLNSPTADTQAQIWHRQSSSLIGDTVQIGFTMSDDQLSDPLISTQEIELHGFIFDINPSQVLA